MNSRRTAKSGKSISLGSGGGDSCTQSIFLKTLSVIHVDWNAIKVAFVKTEMWVINAKIYPQLPIIIQNQKQQKYVSGL